MTWLSPAVLLPVIAWTLLLARLSGDRRGALIHLPAAVGMALGTSSIVWWAIMLLPLASRTSPTVIDALFWITASVVVWRMPASPASPPANLPNRWIDRWLPAALVIAVVAAAGDYFAASSAAAPHGSWDAWAIWNTRARFLFLGYPGEWAQSFSPALSWTHPDYPILVPVSVARAWTFLGSEHVTVPIFVAAAFCAGVVSTAAVSVSRRVTIWRGVVTAMMLLASPAFLRNAVSQCADIPLAFYILTTIVFIGRAIRSDRTPAWWALAGLAAGLAAWTKNEGIAFAVIALLVCAAWAIRSNRPRCLGRILPLAAGAAPALVALVVFKVFFAPANDLVAAQSTSHVLTGFSDLHRLHVIVIAVGRELWFGGASVVGVLPILGLFLLAVGLRRPLATAPLLGLAIAGALIVADVVAYMLTPHDLAWHLGTSLERVIVQVFPALVWCGMSLADRRPVGMPAVPRS